jgi:hypothetical protein
MNNTEFNKTEKQMEQLFATELLNGIAEQTEFVKRSREITGRNIALSLIHSLSSGKIEGIADLQRGFNEITGKNIQYKPFWNQLAKPEFPRYAMETLEHIMTSFSLQSMQAVETRALSRFKDIVIQDGSSFAVKDALSKVFPGRFTKISPAAVELHATMSLFTNNMTNIALSADKDGERQFLPDPDDLKEKLLLADRGYENIFYCDDVHNAGGNFIIRFKGSSNPTVIAARDAHFRNINIKEMPLKKAIKKFRKQTVDLDVRWTKGKRQISLRMIMSWNPRKKQYWLLVTNLKREQFPVDLIVQYYRLRWQIEQVFKEWKSYANLHKFDTGKANIAEGLIWFSIAAAFIKRYLALAVQQISQTAEISTRKVAMCLKIHFTRLVTVLMQRRKIKTALKELVCFLSRNAKRAHPTRDRTLGSRNCGLEPIFVIEWGGLKD